VTKETGDSVKQIKIVQLDARFSPRARERIVGFLESFVSFKPTLGLLYGNLKADGSGKGSWSITAFSQSIIDDMVEMYAGFGAVIFYDIDGLRVAIPQLAHIDELESGVLDFVDDRIQPRSTQPRNDF